MLQPAARLLGITVAEPQLEARVRERLSELGSLSWSAFAAQARMKWPSYVEQFQQLATLAPNEDADVMRVLVAHERALVHFSEIEEAWPTTLKSLEPLTAFVALLGGGRHCDS